MDVLSESADNTHQLDIVCIVLSTIVKSISHSFDSGRFSVADRNHHVYSVSVIDGTATLSSSSPVVRPALDYDSKRSTAYSDCDSSLVDIADSLKRCAEEANEISIQLFVLRFGVLHDRPPVLLACDGSASTPSSRVVP